MLDLQFDAPPSTHGVAAALDFCKAFDSLEPAIALHALGQWGFAGSALQLLEHQWRSQVRWSCVGGSVAPEPLHGARGLPQGDPFAPLALAAALQPVLSRCQGRYPDVKQVLFLDDRTFAASTLDRVLAVVDDWDVFGRISGMRTNNDKTQIWGRTQATAVALQGRHPAVKDEGEVLGLSWACPADAKLKLKRPVWTRFGRKPSGLVCSRSVKVIDFRARARSSLPVRLEASSSRVGLLLSARFLTAGPPGGPPSRVAWKPRVGPAPTGVTFPTFGPLPSVGCWPRSADGPVFGLLVSYLSRILERLFPGSSTRSLLCFVSGVGPLRVGAFGKALGGSLMSGAPCSSRIKTCMMSVSLA